MPSELAEARERGPTLRANRAQAPAADPRASLVRALVLVVLAAAMLTAPFFLFAERFDAEHGFRVAASNGACTALCLALLALLRRGRVELAARALVIGLLALVAGLAWTNGEPVHVNVVNFVLVTVLASAVLERGAMLAVAGACAAAMVAIAWKQAGEELFESVVQFLPSFAVIAAILWLRGGGRG